MLNFVFSSLFFLQLLPALRPVRQDSVGRSLDHPKINGGKSKGVPQGDGSDPVMQGGWVPWSSHARASHTSTTSSPDWSAPFTQRILVQFRELVGMGRGGDLSSGCSTSPVTKSGATKSGATIFGVTKFGVSSGPSWPTPPYQWLLRGWVEGVASCFSPQPHVEKGVEKLLSMMSSRSTSHGHPPAASKPLLGVWTRPRRPWVSGDRGG